MDQANGSSTSPQTLPASAVAEIFQALHGNYGSRFLNQWRTGQIIDGGQHHGKDAGLVNAMAFWGQKLGTFSNRLACIRAVLDKLPKDPPSLPEFVELCSQQVRHAELRESAPRLDVKPTPEDEERARAAAAAAAKAIKCKVSDGIDAHWGTHPIGHLHLKAIFEAADNDRRYRHCIDAMVAEGVCTADGHLLKTYGAGQWWPVHRRAA